MTGHPKRAERKHQSMCELQGHRAMSLPCSVIYLLSHLNCFSISKEEHAQLHYGILAGHLIGATGGNEAGTSGKTCSIKALTPNLSAHRDFTMV